MHVLPIINRLKGSVANLGGRISGAADMMASVLDKPRLPLPCAFVMRNSGTGESDPGGIGQLNQVHTETFGIAIIVDNSAGDETGFAASETLDDIMDQIMTAMLGWCADDYHNPFEFVLDQHVLMDRGMLIHQMTFRCSDVITGPIAS